MKSFLVKYGQYFWTITLIPTLWSWVDLFIDDGDFFFTIFFTGFSIYFYMLGTGRLTADKDPFRK
tara:strand:+ start:377 stop:571 length:195 start_codon:yes stop_codon:yes gene_type:complete